MIAATKYSARLTRTGLATSHHGHVITSQARKARNRICALLRMVFDMSGHFVSFTLFPPDSKLGYRKSTVQNLHSAFLLYSYLRYTKGVIAFTSFRNSFTFCKKELSVKYSMPVGVIIHPSHRKGRSKG